MARAKGKSKGKRPAPVKKAEPIKKKVLDDSEPETSPNHSDDEEFAPVVADKEPESTGSEDDEPVANSGSKKGRPPPKVSKAKGRRGKPIKRKQPKDDEEDDGDNGDEAEDSKPVPAKRKPSKKGRKSSTPAKTSNKSKNSKEESESEEDEGKEYEVDRILETQVHKNGKREFLVKWKGYSIDKATWEPESNLEGSEELVGDFLKKVDDNYLSRARKLRQSTQRSTRASVSRSLDRVHDGRVSKSRSKNIISNPKYIELRMSSELEQINGIRRGSRSSDTLEEIRVMGLDNASELGLIRGKGNTRTRRTAVRAAILSCGMLVSVGAAILLSSSSTIQVDRIIADLMEHLQAYREMFSSQL